MKRYSLVLFVMLLSVVPALSQEKTEEFKPHGKPILRIYSNFHTSSSNGETEKAFELTRVYLGYEHFFSKNFSGKAIYDVADPGVGKHQMSAFVKIAELQYETDKWDVAFGLISTTQFKFQEDFWGYRYMLKSFQDEYGFASSADLGISIGYQLTDWAKAEFSIFNGEGYKKLESDNIFKNAAGITLEPVKGLNIRGLYDWMGKDINQQSYIGFIGYSTKKFNAGAEYNYQKNHNMVEDRNWWGTSVYASYIPSKKMKVFARWDDLSSEKNGTAAWNISKDGQLLVLGMEYAPLKGVKLTPNFQGWNPADETKLYLSTFLLNCEIRF